MTENKELINENYSEGLSKIISGVIDICIKTGCNETAKRLNKILENLNNKVKNIIEGKDRLK